MRLLDRARVTNRGARPEEHRGKPGEHRAGGRRRARTLTIAGFLVPGALMVYLGFSAGGFFPGATALVALVLAIAMAVRAAVAADPLAGVSRPLLVSAVAFAAYSIWALVSFAWSGAPARVLLEFDRTLLYLLALLVFGSLLHTAPRLRLIVRGLLLGAVAICVAGLISRLLPTLLSVEPTTEGRLDFPLTYEGSLGLIACLGIVFSLQLAMSVRQSAAARVIGSMTVPLLATTLLLTLSRASIVATVVGVVAFLVIARPRGTLTGLLAVVPPTVVAVLVTYDASSLFEPVAAGAEPAGAPGVALMIALSMLGAALTRLTLLPMDTRLASGGPSRPVRRAALAASGVMTTAALLAAIVLGAPQALERQFERLVQGDTASSAETEDARTRLTGAAGSVQIRLEYWSVALDAFAEEPVSGHGAGTYAVVWAQDRPESAAGNKVEDAHSLYLETLAELGAVGLLLLLVALGTIFFGFFRGVRGSERSVYAALLAAGLAWAVHAAMDWDWEMPAVTLWLFAAGGAALAARPHEEPALRRPRLPARIAIAAGVLVLALTPALVALSEYHLGNAEVAATEGDCVEAIDSALASISVLGVRPEPFETLGTCDLRLGAPALAVPAFERAVQRDPENWRYHYGLAIARGANGADPRSAARDARRLNPLNPQTEELVQLFDTDDPQEWERRALMARPASD